MYGILTFIFTCIMAAGTLAPGDASESKPATYTARTMRAANQGRPAVTRIGLFGAAPCEEALDALANKPYRPLWAPAPMLRGDTTGIALLHKLLLSPNAKSRARSAFLLGQIASPNSVDLLARRLRDPNRDVRIQSGIALTCMGDARGVPVCSAALGDAPSWIRYYAAYGLWRANTRAAKRALRKRIQDRDALVSQTIREALKTPYVAPPPVHPQRAGIKQAPDVPPDQVWRQACDAFITESDWWWHRGNFNQSIRCLEAAVFLNPHYIEGYTSIAWLQWNMGDDPAAIGTLNRAISAAPFDPEAHYGLGFHYFNTKRYSQAEMPLKRAVELGGDHRTRRTYAHCLEKLGKLEKALEQWSAILEARPADAAAQHNFARVKKLIEEAK